MNKSSPGTIASPRDRFLSALLYLLPQHAISRLIFHLTRLRVRLKNPLLRWFIKHYQVDLSEALSPDINDYSHFNEFFTRALKPEARPVDMGTDALVSPVDGTISQIGTVHQGTLIQAKGRDYRLLDLVGGRHELAGLFSNGRFATLYLSPRDYHRVHMPLPGRLSKMIHIPGRLFSVAPHTTRAIKNLFARNERIVTCFENNGSKFLIVLVGAINVAAIETVWHGLVENRHPPVAAEYDYSDRNITLEKGGEMGRFNLGSTVILLMPDSVEWLPELAEGEKIQYGQKIGIIKK